jgi:hypothetical protein
VRLKAGLSVNTYNGENITISSTGATSKTVSCSGSVTSPPPPEAPVATAASNIDEDSFTANWGSVFGATGYRLDVFTGGGTTELVNTGFEGSTSFPTGWTQNSSYVNNNSSEAYAGTYYAGMNAADDYFYTPLLASPTTISFWIRGSSTTANNTTKVQYSSNANTWTDIATFSANGSDTGDYTNSWSQKTIIANLSGSYYIRWFMSQRSGGSAYFDDVLIVSSGLEYLTGFENIDVSNVTSYAVTGLAPSTEYHYVVRAYNAYGTSSDSNEITVSTTASSVAPDAPLATDATNVSHDAFTANWNASDTATSYRLDVSTSNTFSTFVAGYNDLTVNATSQSVTGLSEESTYYYRVRAVNTNGTSVNSNTISVTTATYDPYDGYYTPVTGLSGNALKTGLQDLIDTNTNMNYIDARTLLFQTLDKVDGYVRCVYTGQDYAIDNEYNGSDNPDTEHAYAQSWFDGSIESIKKADVHNLFITTKIINASRANLPFDVVTNTTSNYASYNGYVSKRGTNANGQTVFEPADQIKGNIARALLYFHVRYGQTLSQGGVDMLDRLISWHEADPVDDDELEDNTLIFDFQSNRNPFIDHPEYVSSIWGGSVSTTTIQFSPASATVNEDAGTITLNIRIQNHAATATTADVVLISGTAADVNNYSTVPITFPASSSADQTVTLTITDDSIMEGTEQLVFALQNVSGGNSAAAGAYDTFALTIVDNDIPAPVATAATDITDDSFTANWDAASGITDYELDLSTSSSFASFVNGYEAYPVSATSLSISGLTSNTVYYYRVRSVYNNGVSEDSNTIQLSTSGVQNYVLLNTDYPVFEDFNTLSSGDWNNGTTVTGWYAKTDATASIASYGAYTGSQNPAGLYAFGVEGINPLSDRALGMVTTNDFTGPAGSGKGYIGWRIRNNTGSTIESITVTWTGEQWLRQNNSNAHTLDLDYQVGNLVTDLTAGTWTSASSMFTSPITGDSGTTLLDGNASANRVVDIEAIISGLSIDPNQEIMLRWVDLNDTGTDHVMAIDDVSVSVGYDYTHNIPAEIPETGVTITVSGGNGFNHPNSSALPANPNFNASFRRGIRLVGQGPWTITVATTNPWVAYLRGDTWTSLSNTTLESVQFEVSSSKGETIEILAGDGGNPTLPVELSTFTVQLNGYNHAVLTWVTQTETGVSGFYVYRNSGDDLATAELVSNLIPATNTSQQQVYMFTDKELYQPGTYYYWLQSSDLDGTDSFYGPINVVYTGSEPQNPGAPAITTLKGIYPNPFNPSTTISYSLAKAGDVNIRIFNSRGQLVRNYQQGLQNAGNYNLIWNGQDDNGQNMSSGVYFFRMQAGDKVFSSKAVLLK